MSISNIIMSKPEINWRIEYGQNDSEPDFGIYHTPVIENSEIDTLWYMKYFYGKSMILD